MFPYTALSVAISIFIMRGVFQTVPKDLTRLRQNRRGKFSSHADGDRSPAGPQRYRGGDHRQLRVRPGVNTCWRRHS